MILGYLDKDDRAYDLNFATLKMKIRVETEGSAGAPRIAFYPRGSAVPTTFAVLGEADVTVGVSMDHAGDRVPLLRPVEGHLYRHERGLLFLATPPRRDPEDPTFFLVKLHAMPSAVKFFFEDQEGTELVSIPTDEILRVQRDATILVSAANVALPKERLAYAVEVRPSATAMPLLDGLPMSSSA
ncbi:MAG: hypothetical protein ACT4OI_07785 [Methanobacteriota archaeon]